MLRELVICIEHVGSTSVKGLSAKPIIDLDVVIPDYQQFNEVILRLEKIGYEYEGDLGIEDRHAFKYSGKSHLMTHHLYVCPKNSDELKRHLAFRDYLRNHEDAVKEYSNVKIVAAKLFPSDIDAYCNYKSSVINEIYKKIGLDK